MSQPDLSVRAVGTAAFTVLMLGLAALPIQHTFAVFSDFETSSARVGAGAWLGEDDPALPVECEGMTFDRIILGTRGRPETITGTSGNDLIFGLNGKDEIFGLAGDDCLVGWNGKDNLDGGEGEDVLVGGNGKDDLEGGEGCDDVSGGRGKDEEPGEDASCKESDDEQTEAQPEQQVQTPPLEQQPPTGQESVPLPVLPVEPPKKEARTDDASATDLQASAPAAADTPADDTADTTATNSTPITEGGQP